MDLGTLKRNLKLRLRWMRRLEGVSRSLRIAALRQISKLSRSSAVFGPPKGWVANTAEWLAKQPAGSGSRLITAIPAARLTHRPPKCPDPALAANFVPFIERDVPPFTVSVLRDARVWGHYAGVVITPTDEVIADLSRDFWGIERNAVFTRLRLPRVRRIAGTVADICTPEAFANYWHWTHDLMPRLRVLELAGFTPEKVDAYLVNSNASAWQTELLRDAGIAGEKIIRITDADHIQAGTLVVPSRKATNYDIFPWMCE